ncbi:MAG: DUF362 domain-containing protein [Desulfobacteraceae bacterium]|nr:DUF362 domain-containing protein [Desulfobacteraceae bacterium]
MTETKKLLTRRDFIRGTVGATLAASVMNVPWATSVAAATGPSMVTVVRDEKVMDNSLRVDAKILKAMVDKAVMQIADQSDASTAWNSLFKKDDIVGLVNTPHLNPTHPEMVQVVTESLMEFVGIAQKNIREAQGGSRRAKKCSALISVPALKAHWLTGIGTVLKNYIMYSGRPTHYHEEDSAKLGEIWLKPEIKGKTRLILVDALHPLCDKGPQPDPRYKWAYNAVIGGVDPVAVETVCLKVITQKRHALRGEPWPISPPPLCIEAADKVYGLGTSDLAKIKIKTIGWEKDLLL